MQRGPRNFTDYWCSCTAQRDKEAAAKAQQQLKLSALGAAETGLAAEEKAKADARKSALEADYRIQEILKQTGDMELAQSQANWKASLQDDQQAAAEAIERLKQVGDKESIGLVSNLNRKTLL